MSASALAVIGYIAWTLILIITMEVLRASLVLGGRRVATSFAPDGSDVSPFAHRLARAHANCYESFPIIGGLLLFALAIGQASVTDPLALWALAARVSVYRSTGDRPRFPVQACDRENDGSGNRGLSPGASFSSSPS